VQKIGDPVATTDAYVRYQTSTGFVQFDFTDEQLTMLVLMSEVVGDQADRAPTKLTDTMSSMQGELTVFTGAIGRAMFSPPHLAIIDLIGHASDSFDEERGGISWQVEVSGSTGVVLQFREEILVSALITLSSDAGETAYPTAETLIDGLPLPSDRQSVAARFGGPHQSEGLADLYVVDGVQLRFDFLESGPSALLTVAAEGVDV